MADIDPTTGLLDINEVRALLESAPLGTYQGMLQDRMNAVDKVFPLKMGNVFFAPFQGMLLGNDMDNKKGEEPTRYMATTAWNSFGAGFHLTWLSMVVLTLFMVFLMF